MAIILETRAMNITTEERTYRIQIECPKGEIPLVTAFRETITYDESGMVLGRVGGVAEVRRSAERIAPDIIEASGASVTGAQLAAIIAQAADQWRREDIEANKIALQEIVADATQVL